LQPLQHAYGIVRQAIMQMQAELNENEGMPGMPS
jgi:hypothetical protein